MKWTPGNIKPNHFESYMITTDTSIYYAYYDSKKDCFYLKADYDIHDLSLKENNLISNLIPRSEVKSYISLIDLYLDSTVSN